MTDNKTHAADEDVRVTEPFVISSGAYLNVIMHRWLRRYGWLMLLPVAGVAAAGLVLRDERIAIVALLLIFIIMPMVMLFIYMYYMLTPQARRVVLHKRVVIAQGRYLRLEYLPEPHEESTEEDDNGSPGKYLFPLPQDETISWDCITQVNTTPRYIVFVLRGKPRQLILIPHSALKN